VGAAALVVSCSLLLSATGCASRALGPERIAGGISAPFAPRLTSLADNATFAWVPPAELLDGLSERDLESVEFGSITSMQTQVTTLARSRSWRQATPAEADYLLSLVQIHRSGVRPVDRPARADGRDGLPICRGMSGEAKGVNCREERVIRSDSSSTIVAWMTLVVQHRADGTRWTRTVPLNMHRTFEPQAFLEPMLKLFLASEP
jgi:hypothetical protein